MYTGGIAYAANDTVPDIATGCEAAFFNYFSNIYLWGYYNANYSVLQDDLYADSGESAHIDPGLPASRKKSRKRVV